MKNLKTLWNRIPRGWRLALDTAVIVCLLALAVLYWRFPALSAASAFRRGVEDAVYPPAELEHLMEKTNTGLGANDVYAYKVNLWKYRNLWDGLGWRAEEIEAYPAVADGVWCVPFSWESFDDNLLDWFKWEDGKWQLAGMYHDKSILYDETTGEALYVPCFAVKTTGALATLKLVLDECELPPHGEEPTASCPVQYMLAGDEAENGWFVFRFDTQDLYQSLQTLETFWNGYEIYGIDEPYASLIRWMRRYPSWEAGDRPPAHLELRTFDAEGELLRTVVWDLP